MAVWVGLLGSVSLGPDRRLRSEDLQGVARAQGLHPLRTVIASGNLIFEADDSFREAELSARITSGFLALCSREIPAICRPAAEWPALVAGNPFPDQASKLASSVSVRVMAEPPVSGLIEAARSRAAPGESLCQVGDDLWISTPNGFAISSMARYLSRPAAGRGTWRNASAISKIAAACA